MIQQRLPFEIEPNEGPRLRALDRRTPAFRRFIAGLVLPRLENTMPKNLARRSASRLDAYLFGKNYFPHLEWDNVFLPEYMLDLQSAALVKAALIYQKAIAAPRGIGKTTAALIVVLWAILYAHVRFVAILSGSSREAKDRLDTIQHWIKSNDLLNEDFPELCAPIRDCAGDPRRAKMAGFTWSQDECELANGVRVMAQGLQGPVRGLNKQAHRPDFVLLDDIEDEDSVKSRVVSQALEDRFRNEVMGLGESGKRTIFLYLCTLISAECISARVTDPILEPEWRGKRYQALLSEPANMDMWTQYMEMCRGAANYVPAQPLSVEAVAAALAVPSQAVSLYTPPHQAAIQFYLAHQAAMDEGAVCLDPRRRPLHDLYFERATRGEHYWLCEIQQTPPRSEALHDRVLDVPFLRSKITSTAQGIMPRWSDTVICSIDVGQNRLHWEMDAWDAQLVTSHVCRIGQESTHLDAGAIEMAEMDRRKSIIANALRLALERLRLLFSEGLVKEDTGEVVKPSIIVIDCGGAAKLAQAQSWAWYEHVLRLCGEFGSTWRPFKGAEWSRSIADRAAGRNWIREAANNPFGRIDANADYYKSRLMDAYESPACNPETKAHAPGTRLLFAGISTAYLLHQTAEKLQERTLEGKPVDRAITIAWVKRPLEEGGYAQNHWWDTGWLQFAAADYLRYLRTRPPGTPRKNKVIPRKEY